MDMMDKPVKSWQCFLDKSLQDIVKSGHIQEFSFYRDLTQHITCFLQGDKARITCIKEYLDTFICHEGKRPEKSLAKSEELRKKGNDCFKKKRLEDSLLYYNQSIAHAPLSKEHDSLALAYANRSAGLYHLRQYQECVDDINRAFDAGYPSSLWYKLHQRKAQALCHLGVTEDAVGEFNNAMAAIRASDTLPVFRKECLLKDIEDWLKEMKENTDSSRLPCPAASQAETGTPSVTGTPGSKLVQASNLVKLHYTKQEGRYLVAAHAINPGDTLLVEKPYAAVLLPDNYPTHCHHCFVKLPLNPLCCDQCTEVRYCSDVCRKESWNSYHHSECEHLNLMHTIGVAHLSLRIILKTGFDKLIDFRNKYQTLKDRRMQDRGTSTNDKYEHGYLAIYDLVHHGTNVTKEDLFQYTLTAVLLLEVLKSVGFFKETQSTSTEISQNKNIDSVSEMHCYVSGLLLRHILQIVCNAHAVTELKTTPDATNDIISTQNQVRIATGLYPTASLMNHSCDPSVISSFQKGTMILRAVKDLNPGEQVYNCYGPHCRRMSKSERQEILKSQYMFTCRCTACQVEPDELEFSQAVRCPKCSGPVVQQHKEVYMCSLCKHEVEASIIIKKFKQAEEMFIEGVILLEKEQFEDALQLLLQCLKQREELLYKHNQQLGHTYDSIARCFAGLGNFDDSAEYLHKSVSITRAIYGKDSIELANELQKLAEVQVNSGDFLKAKETCLPAIDIFETYYGTTHESTMELKKLFLQLTMSDT